MRFATLLIDVGRAADALPHIRAVLADAPHDVEALGLAAMAADLAGDELAGFAYSGALRAARVLPAGPAGPPMGAIVPLTSFADIDGCTDEKHRLERCLVSPFRLRRNLPEGVELPSGVLLYGPRSSGKTTLAAAIAGELHLPFVRLDMAERVDPWGAAEPGAIAAAFAQAGSQGPCLLLLENVEAASHRRLLYTPHGREVLTELHDAMDAHDPTTMVVVATSAAPWLVSPTLRTPKRFDRLVLMAPPDAEARATMLARVLGEGEGPVDADVRSVAVSAEGCTNDDLRDVAMRAAALALDESSAMGSVRRVRADHLRRALTAQPRSGFEWFDLAYNFAEFTDDSHEFDPMFDYIRRHVRKSSI